MPTPPMVLRSEIHSALDSVRHAARTEYLGFDPSKQINDAADRLVLAIVEYVASTTGDTQHG